MSCFNQLNKSVLIYIPVKSEAIEQFTFLLRVPGELLLKPSLQKCQLCISFCNFWNCITWDPGKLCKTSTMPRVLTSTKRRGNAPHTEKQVCDGMTLYLPLVACSLQGMRVFNHRFSKCKAVMSVALSPPQCDAKPVFSRLGWGENAWKSLHTRILISILLLPFVQNATQGTVPSSLLSSQHQPTIKKGPRKHWLTASQHPDRAMCLQWDLLSQNCKVSMELVFVRLFYLPWVVLPPVLPAGNRGGSTGITAQHLARGSAAEEAAGAGGFACAWGVFCRSFKTKLLRIFAWSKGCFPYLRQAATCSQKEEGTEFTPEVFLWDLFSR